MPDSLPCKGSLPDLMRGGGQVVLTGELTDCDRITAMEVFEAGGLLVGASVSRKTKFLIIGNNAKQEKIDHAAQLGIPVYTESELWAAIAEVYSQEKS